MQCAAYLCDQDANGDEERDEAWMVGGAEMPGSRFAAGSTEVALADSS